MPSYAIADSIIYPPVSRILNKEQKEIIIVVVIRWLAVVASPILHSSLLIDHFYGL